MDNPGQWEAWEILSREKHKTSTVCEAVCGYHGQKSLENTLHIVLQEELKRIPLSQALEVEESRGPDVDASILAFLQELQNG